MMMSDLALCMFKPMMRRPTIYFCFFFHYLIKLLIEKRDKEIEATLNYREKLWIGSLDMVNKNLIKMYSA